MGGTYRAQLSISLHTLKVWLITTFSYRTANLIFTRSFQQCWVLGWAGHVTHTREAGNGVLIQILPKVTSHFVCQQASASHKANVDCTHRRRIPLHWQTGKKTLLLPSSAPITNSYTTHSHGEMTTATPETLDVQWLHVSKWRVSASGSLKYRLGDGPLWLG